MTRIQATMEEFQKEDDVASPAPLLRQPFFKERSPKPALVEIGGCEKLAAKSVDLDSYFELGIAAVRVFAASRRGQEGERRLFAVIEKTDQKGYLRFELEARLRLGEMEVNSGSSAGRARLAALEKDANAKDFFRIASKAYARAAHLSNARVTAP